MATWVNLTREQREHNAACGPVDQELAALAKIFGGKSLSQPVSG